jgi:hypothetical protein
MLREDRDRYTKTTQIYYSSRIVSALALPVCVPTSQTVGFAKRFFILTVAQQQKTKNKNM